MKRPTNRSTAVVVAVVGLLLFTALERFSWYGARSSLLFLLMDGADKQGLGLERADVRAIIDRFGLIGGLAPLVGAVLAFVVGARKTLVLGASLMAVGGLLLAASTARSVEYVAGLFAIGHGLAVVSIYAVAATVFESLRFRLALFFGLFAAVNFGASQGPWLAGSVGARFGFRTALLAVAAVAGMAAFTAIAIWAATRRRGLRCEATHRWRSVSTLALLSVLAVGFWWLMGLSLDWTGKALVGDSELSRTGASLATLFSIPLTLVTAIVCLGWRSLGEFVSEREPIVASLVALAAGLTLVYPIVQGDAAVRFWGLAASSILLTVADVLFVPALVVVSTLANARIAPLCIGVFLVAMALAPDTRPDFSLPVLITAVASSLAAATALHYGMMSLMCSRTED